MEQAAATAAGGQAAASGGEDYRAGLAANDQAALGVLRDAWGSLYEIGVYETGRWFWKRRDGLGCYEQASTPDQVQADIAADHGFLPVRMPGDSR